MLSTTGCVLSKRLFATLRGAKGTALLFRRVPPMNVNFDDMPVDKEPNFSPKDLVPFANV